MKVLVSDDDVVSRMVLMHLVAGYGRVEMVEAEDGQEAWEQLESGLRPAIVFCDLRMPRMSGMELLARVRAHPALGDTPFVLVTSASDKATMAQAVGLGASGYLVKPFEAEQVKAYMDALGKAVAPAAPARLVANETAQATLQRLGISAERLLIYLEGFRAQLSAASTDIVALLARGETDAARQRLERLQAGCQTLGLNGPAADIGQLAAVAIERARVEQVLDDTVRAVAQHGDAVKGLKG